MIIVTCDLCKEGKSNECKEIFQSKRTLRVNILIGAHTHVGSFDFCTECCEKLGITKGTDPMPDQLLDALREVIKEEIENSQD